MTKPMKQCPFCGAVNKQGHEPLLIIEGQTYCAACGARGPTFDGTLATSADRWNRRANDHLRSENKRLREALKFYADPTQYIDGEYGYQMIAPIEFDKGEKARAALKEVK